MSRIKKKIISNFDYSKKNYLKEFKSKHWNYTPKKQIIYFEKFSEF